MGTREPSPTKPSVFNTLFLFPGRTPVVHLGGGVLRVFLSVAHGETGPSLPGTGRDFDGPAGRNRHRTVCGGAGSQVLRRYRCQRGPAQELDGRDDKPEDWSQTGVT